MSAEEMIDMEYRVTPYNKRGELTEVPPKKEKDKCQK